MLIAETPRPVALTFDVSAQHREHDERAVLRLHFIAWREAARPAPAPAPAPAPTLPLSHHVPTLGVRAHRKIVETAPTPCPGGEVAAAGHGHAAVLQPGPARAHDTHGALRLVRDADVLHAGLVMRIRVSADRSS